jgi:hypothetical protein
MTRPSTSPSTSPTATARPDISPAKGRQPCAGRCTRQHRSHAIPAPRIAPTTSRPPRSSAATAPASRSRASSCGVAITRYGSSVTTRSRHPSRSRAPPRVAQPRAARQAPAPTGPTLQQPPRPPMLWPLDPGFGCAMQQRLPASRPALPTTTCQPFARVKPSLTLMRRGRLPNDCCRHANRVYRPKRSSGRNASPQRDHPIKHLVADPESTRVVGRSKPGRPRAKPHPLQPYNPSADGNPREVLDNSPPDK